MKYLQIVLTTVCLIAAVFMLYCGGVWKDGGSAIPFVVCAVVALGCGAGVVWVHLGWCD